MIFYLWAPRDGGYSGAMVELESGTGANIDTVTFANGKLSLEMNGSVLKFEGMVQRAQW